MSRQPQVCAAGQQVEANAEEDPVARLDDPCFPYSTTYPINFYAMEIKFFGGGTRTGCTLLPVERRRVDGVLHENSAGQRDSRIPLLEYLSLKRRATERSKDIVGILLNQSTIVLRAAIQSHLRACKCTPWFCDVDRSVQLKGESQL